MRSIKYLLRLSIIAVLISCNPPTEQSQEYSWALLPFTKADDVNPVLLPDTNSTFLCPVRNTIVQWEEKDVFNPAAVVRNDTVFLLFRAEDSIGKFAGTSRIGIAWSTDGLHFTKHPVPVLYPDNDSSKIFEWEGGCEDPRIVEDENGTYYMTYTAYDGDKARLLVASSKDLYHWNKHGHVFKNDTAEVNKWSKSGSIVCKYENGKAIASKVDGRYWMYWGDTDIFLATSNDLINWFVSTDDKGNPKTIFGPRNKKFDSRLVEPGPPAMLTEKGIVLIYNSMNLQAKGDTSLAEGTYAASQILFDKNDPAKVIDRMETYFMKPDKPYEITGQVNHVCFVEGLVLYKGKWFLYYGTADSKIAVAVK
jgi:beta-1,2-mannosidase